MEIKPSVEIENLEGQPIPITKIAAVCPHCNKKLEVDDQFRGIIVNTGENVTLKSTCVNALSSLYRGDENLDGMEKQKRGKLALKIFLIKDNDTVHLTSGEVEDLKKFIGKKDDPVTVMRAYELLDPIPKQEKKSKKKR